MQSFPSLTMLLVQLTQCFYFLCTASLNGILLPNSVNLEQEIDINISFFITFQIASLKKDFCLKLTLLNDLNQVIWNTCGDTVSPSFY